MNIIRYIYILFFLNIFLPTFGQDYIESTSHNPTPDTKKRTLQYIPDGDDFVCINGKNRYTRALYGDHLDFRIETSDKPVFAAYEKKNSKNIRFIAKINGRTFSLDSVNYCESRYTPGKRSYILKDSSWNNGELQISVLSFFDKRGGIWKIESYNMPENSALQCVISEIKNQKLSRNGDLGVDPPDSFDAAENNDNQQQKAFKLDNDTHYIICINQELSSPDSSTGKTIYDKTEKKRQILANQIRIETPDPYINTIGGALSVAADGIWDGETWQHGAVGWRMPLSGWRAAYTGDCLGWHDRARTHFDAYAASQVTDISPIYPHPTQDSTMNLARAEKKWGTQMYSNGYICRNPKRNDQMHHYDMNLCYIDELLWHLNWTGDLDYARKIWPVLQKHLEWEKRNFDLDNDGLYDAYCCIWASDALYYNSGAVTHSSAYNYRANKMAAEIADLIGEDATPYKKEAEKILNAINNRLWMPDKGVWAEFQDFMGKKRLHKSPAIWTIYHAIDGEIANPFQAYRAIQYIDNEIPHIPVIVNTFENENYAVISTTNWLPYAWSINNVAYAEIMHTSLAYWQAGRNDEAFNLFKSSILDEMYLGSSPGNFGQISYYDAARGECYRDFGDNIGIASRAIVQGLFGIIPDAVNGKLLLRPGFPSEWNQAAIHTPDIDFSFSRNNQTDTFHISSRLPKVKEITLIVRARGGDLDLSINGKSAKWKSAENCIENPYIQITWQAKNVDEIVINWKNSLEKYTVISQNNDFAQVTNGKMSWWIPKKKTEEKIKTINYGTILPLGKLNYETVNIEKYFNANVTDIFKNEYLSPRSPYTTLQIPKQGIGEWCHPQETAEIDDSGFREQIKDNVFKTSSGIPFRSSKNGKNIIYTSLWDNYPNKTEIPLEGKAKGIILLMAGSTNHMQCHIENGCVSAIYKDGSKDSLNLINPENWCPIEQDFYENDLAFKLKTVRPYRVCLKTGLTSNNLEKDMNIKGIYGRRIDGGAATILYIPLDDHKELSRLALETLSNDVVIGIMSITLIK